MLLSFRAANHRSLRDEQQLLLTPQYGSDMPDDAEWTGVPVIGIFGANASGKSNMLDALRYMRQMVLRSQVESEPEGGVVRYPFALDPSGTDHTRNPSTGVWRLVEDIRTAPN